MATTRKPTKKKVTTITKTKVRKGKFALTTPKAIGRTTTVPYSLSRYKIS